MTATAYKIKPPKEVTFESGPWYGIRDAVQPTASDPRYLSSVQNMWIRDLPNVPYLDVRPGFVPIGIRQGSGATRIGQRWVQFTKLDGTEYTIGFCDGLVLVYDWNTDTISEPVTTANLTTASITLSATARVYVVVIANTLVVSDGVNTPWMWDGTVGAGGLTSLTNSPVLYGQPAIYYGKLFGIKNTERNTLVWSEENDPTTGYEAGGYNNAWTLAQTEQEGFYALAATDTALTCFRARSITQVLGSVTTDFQATGTREGVSSTIGCVSPAGVSVYDNVIYFLGSDRQFYKIVGSTLSEVAAGIRRTTHTAVSESNLAAVVAANWTDGGGVIFGLPYPGVVNPVVYHLLINPLNDECTGIFVWAGETLDEVKNGSGLAVLIRWGAANTTVAATSFDGGYAYAHGRVDGPLYGDTRPNTSGGASFTTGDLTGMFITGYVGYDTRTDKAFTLADLSLLLPTDVSQLYATYTTNVQENILLTSMAVTASGAGHWDVDAWDEFEWGGGSVERHIGLGMRGTGRWVQLTVTGSSAGTVTGTTGDPGGLNERFQVQSLMVRAHLLDRRPRLT